MCSLSQSLFFLFLHLNLSSSLFLSFHYPDLPLYPFHVVFFFLFSHSFTHSLAFNTDSHSFTLCLSPSPHSQSTLLFHLLSSLARSCCHWSVLASLHFSYQTRAHLATVAGLSSDWGCPDYEGSSL